jgi:hypothetical protein
MNQFLSNVMKSQYQLEKMDVINMKTKQTNSIVSVRKANYTDRAAAACRRS